MNITDSIRQLTDDDGNRAPSPPRPSSVLDLEAAEVAPDESATESPAIDNNDERDEAAIVGLEDTLCSLLFGDPWYAPTVYQGIRSSPSLFVRGLAFGLELSVLSRNSLPRMAVLRRVRRVVEDMEAADTLRPDRVSDSAAPRSRF
ncbi:hypothetical protein BWQ96_10424 [Gracilariopsis chorda]|uniref:Uncharacterized protein n=1 Tax=Gracilariopsis chorda TaxID=448386 RepID=A0A2V3ICP4_9FLOR|nr:hypothetical protein BWQ96_10424 [Gracilariopsis chorda]|eukprot:PXF39862.1 hypothetical protein BWQ96_10424 [Gracilariopsis chorda]